MDGQSDRLVAAPSAALRAGLADRYRIEGEPRRVTRDPGGDFSPDFSPDGRQITFHSTRKGTRDVYVINVDGSDERRLTSDDEQSYDPAFSPDGLRIAFGNGP